MGVPSVKTALIIRRKVFCGQLILYQNNEVSEKKRDKMQKEREQMQIKFCRYVKSNFGFQQKKIVKQHSVVHEKKKAGQDANGTFH